MKFFVRWMHRTGIFVFDVRVLYLLVGFTVSILAHELVHIVIHMGNIQAIHLFPTLGTIVELNADLPSGYNLDNEEAIAYAITFLIQFITIIDVFAIHDSRDRKTPEQLIFGNKSSLSLRESDLLLQMVSK